MKRLLTILFLLISINAFSTTFYVSTSGSDGSGDGSIGNPWRTAFHACATVTTAGDIIHVEAGTFNEGNVQIALAAGVNLEGVDSNSTKINGSFYSVSQSSAFLQLISGTEGTDGNQFIHDIWFDTPDSVSIMILVRMRKNVAIYRCKFGHPGQGADGGAVFFNGKANNTQGYFPTTYATGNQMVNCTVYDCQDRQKTAGSGGGSVSFTGQDGLLIHDVKILNRGRAQGHNGDCFAAVPGNTGANKNMLFYNDTCLKPMNEGSSFNACFELWYNLGGNEIRNCWLSTGGNAIDIGTGDGVLGAGHTYSWYIHDNIITDSLQMTNTGFNGVNSIGVQIEPEANPDAGYLIITHNTFSNIGTAFQATLSHGTIESLSNVQFTNNLCTNMGYQNSGSAGNITALLLNVGVQIYNINISNNTFIGGIVGGSNGAARSALYMESDSGKPVRKIYFQNNIVKNTTNYGVVTYKGLVSGVIDSIYIQNGDFYNNANQPTFTVAGSSVTVTHEFISGNITGDPLLDANFKLQAGSPAIGAGLGGVDIGAFPYVGPTPNNILIILHGGKIVLTQ